MKIFTDNEGNVTMSKEDYLKLCDRLDKLDCLEAAGVDNWEWYDDAMEFYRQGNQEIIL